MNRVLAVIPARGGSKGVPRKNLRLVGGRPLIAWSIDAALASRKVNRVVVSSDCPEILAEAEKLGAVPLVRPAFLATDTATIEATLKHVVRTEPERPDIVVSLQPTVPVRRPGLVDDCIQRMYDTDADSVFTAHPEPNMWWREDKQLWAEHADWRTNNPDRLQRQQMKATDLEWAQDGSVIVSRVHLLDSGKAQQIYPPRRIGGRVQVYPNERTVDIDTEEDLALADRALLYRAGVFRFAESA